MQITVRPPFRIYERVVWKSEVILLTSPIVISYKTRLYYPPILFMNFAMRTDENAPRNRKKYKIINIRILCYINVAFLNIANEKKYTILVF